MTLLAVSPSTSSVPCSSMRTRSPPILASGPEGFDVKCRGSRGRWIRIVCLLVSLSLRLKRELRKSETRRRPSTRRSPESVMAPLT